MERWRFSLISHGQMRFWNPLPVEGLLTVLRELPLERGKEVLDYGSGPGAVSAELASRYEARITGVDPNPEAIARCRATVNGRFLAEEFRAARFEAASFDLVVNIGASPGMSVLLDQVIPLLRRPGRLLVGDMYWRRPPSEELLAFLGQAEGCEVGEQRAALMRRGFVVERSLVATDADWDRYEDEYDANMASYLRAHPNDPMFHQFEARRRSWREIYLKHGRGTLGFALYQARLDV